MLYYVGKGTKFKKEECKEYKKINNALKAATKNEALTVWDENGTEIGGLTDNVPEGALNTNQDGSVNAYDENGKHAGTVDAETVAELTGNEPETSENDTNEGKTENEPSELENSSNEENTTSENGEDDSGQQDGVIVPQGTMKVTVVCDGALNLRRSPTWSNENICGRAVRGQTYYAKEIHMVDGKKMVRTIDDLYLSGLPEHVLLEEM